jgi:glutamate racemase
LACTHYPLLKEKIQKFLPGGVQVIAQGEIVAQSLQDYLYRHPEIERRITKNSERIFYTTDSAEDFNTNATIFFGCPVKSKHLEI